MAITRAQQARQMLKEGSEPVVQGGVENYLGRQPEVQAPRKWQSGPNKPPTELAYITEAEKDLLLKYYKFECRSCGNTNLKRVVSLGYQPLANNLLNKKNESCDLYPLEVNFCDKCYNM